MKGPPTRRFADAEIDKPLDHLGDILIVVHHNAVDAGISDVVVIKIWKAAVAAVGMMS